LNRNPKSYDGLRLAADIAVASGDRATAIQRLRDANALKPWQPQTILALMQNLVAANQVQEAETIGKELISRDKTVAQAYDLLYYVDVRLGQYDKAEAMLKTKMANMPADGPTRLELAAFYYARDRRREMLGILDAFRSDQKTFPQGDGMVGDFYFRIGEINSAIQTYREGAKNQPKLSLMFDKRIAEALLVQGHYEQAMQLADKLHKENPKDLEATALHASLLARGNPQQVQAAIAQLEALVEKQPGNPMLQMNLGRAYVLKGDRDSVDKAKQHFEISVALNRDSVPAKLALAEIQLVRGQNREAMQIAEDALRLSPGNIQAQLTRSSALAKMGISFRTRMKRASGWLRSTLPRSITPTPRRPSWNWFAPATCAALRDWPGVKRHRDSRLRQCSFCSESWQNSPAARTCGWRWSTWNIDLDDGRMLALIWRSSPARARIRSSCNCVWVTCKTAWEIKQPLFKVLQMRTS